MLHKHWPPSGPQTNRSSESFVSTGRVLKEPPNRKYDLTLSIVILGNIGVAKMGKGIFATWDFEVSAVAHLDWTVSMAVREKYKESAEPVLGTLHVGCIMAPVLSRKS